MVTTRVQQRKGPSGQLFKHTQNVMHAGASFNSLVRELVSVFPKLFSAQTCQISNSELMGSLDFSSNRVAAICPRAGAAGALRISVAKHRPM
jgi:hypothetical protein